MTPRRILIVQTAYLGDVVLTTPLFDALRRDLPDASLDLITTVSGAALLEGDPRLSSVDTYDKRHSLPGAASLVGLARRLAVRHYDVAIAAQRSWRSGLLVRASNAALRVGFDAAPGAWAYTRAVDWDAASHQSARYVALAEALPWAAPARARVVPRPALYPSSAGNDAATRALVSSGLTPDRPWLCVAPGSARATKRWPVERYAQLTTLAASRGLRCVLLGSAAERPLARSIVEAAGSARPISLVGRLPLGVVPALISRAAVLVGNDSAPAHIAAAVGTPVVAVFGPTDPRHGYVPLGERVRVVSAADVECRPCSPRGPRRCPRGDLLCLQSVAPAQVLDAVVELLDSTARRELCTVS